MTSWVARGLVLRPDPNGVGPLKLLYKSHVAHPGYNPPVFGRQTSVRYSGRLIATAEDADWTAPRSGRSDRAVPSAGVRFSTSGPDECQQIGVDRLGLGGRHAVWETGVTLERPVLHELRGQGPGIGIGNDLVVLAMHHQHRHADLLQVLGE